jgi:serine protease inhibitor
MSVHRSEWWSDAFRMIVGRPFYMAIRENQTRTILFHGAIENPSGR